MTETSEPKKEADTPPKQPKGQLGTLAGVFTPSILTILGIILFLRLGFVVGSAGLAQALVILGIAHAISIVTSISLSAIATNLRMKVGGDYYLISRTLGPEFGGALGVVLFLAQAISVAFYAIGFGEALAALLGRTETWAPQVIAAAAVAVLFVIAWLGADWATKFQFVVMAVLIAALVSFFMGAIPRADEAILRESWSPSGNLTFWAIFALFFPAVTGFTQGVSMSGDLRDPGKSIPLGTFLAVGVSGVIYFVIAILFASVVPGSELVANPTAMRDITSFGPLFDAGVFAATLSSALASFLGAPRILQSLATDRVFPFLGPFAKGVGATNNPRNGVLLSAVIAFATIAMGSLDLIAPIVSMFFLISYGLLNYATYYEAKSNSPSFRPRIRFYHRRLSLLGAVGCVGAMLALDPTAGAVAIVILFSLFQYLRHSVDVRRWSDSSRSARFQRIRADLLELSSDADHSRDWRPVILAFSDNPGRRGRLLRFASWIEGGSGLTTAVRIVEGNGALARRKGEELEAEMRADIVKRELSAFPLVIVSPSGDSTFSSLLQGFGLGPIRANTGLLNWYDRKPGAEGEPGLRSYGHYLRMMLREGLHLVVLAATIDRLKSLERTPSKKRRIDVLWRGDASSKLMLLFAYLMTRHDDWEASTIRVIAAADEGKDAASKKAELEEILEDVRIEAEPLVLAGASRGEFIEAAKDASLVFVPFRLKDERPLGPFEGSVDSLVDELPMTALVHAAQDVELDEEPDEGRPGEIAGAMDAATEAKKKATEAVEASEAAAKELKKLREALAAARANGKDPAKIRELAEAEAKAAEESEKAIRRAAKARAKAELAERAAQEIIEDV